MLRECKCRVRDTVVIKLLKKDVVFFCDKPFLRMQFKRTAIKKREIRRLEYQVQL